MTQQNALYTIVKQDNNAICLHIKKDHPVYQGHFPGNPITPGVLTLQMVRECVSNAIGKNLRYHSIKKCRFLGLVRPENNLKLTFSTTETNGIVTVNALLSDAENDSDVRLELESEML